MWKATIASIFITFMLSSYCLEVNALVCPENVCEKLQCDSVDVCEGPDKLIKKGGFCGCCDTCFSIVGAGEYCGLPLYGLPPASIMCKEGMSCIGGFCVQRNIDVYK